MRFCIYANTDKDVGCFFTGKILDYLDAAGASWRIYEKNAQFFPGKTTFSVPDKSDDVVIVIGGDGTMLEAAVQCAKANVPIFGFNMGHVGFLTEGEPNNFSVALSALLSGKYKKEKRALLKCSVCGGDELYALNDIVVERSEGKMITALVYSDDRFIDKHRCDGIIVSTPTGSTAYSLSAGGPIVSPSAEVMALTPVNAHSLHSKPMIVGKDERLTVKLGNNDRAKLFSDGKAVATLSEKSVVTVEYSDIYATFLRTEKYNFYKKLLEKLNNWSVVSDVEE